jgi:hypothetical protein
LQTKWWIQKSRCITNKVEGSMNAELTAPPFVPKPVGDRPAKKTNCQYGNYWERRRNGWWC